MSGATINQLVNAGVLTGAEAVPVWQGSTTVQTTVGKLSLLPIGSVNFGTAALWTGGDIGLGVGTTTPTARLHVSGGGGVSSTIRIEGTGSNSAAFLHLKTSAIYSGSALVADTDDTVYERHYSAYTVNSNGTITYTATFPYFRGAGDQIILGGTQTTQPTTTGMGGGDVGLYSGKGLMIMNAAASSFGYVLNLDANNNLLIGKQNNEVIGFGAVNATALATGSAAEIMLISAKALRSANNAASSSLRLIEGNASDRVLVDGGGVGVQFGLGMIALGGGAAPTVGTIGGSGPASAAQNSWKKEWDSSGNPYWIPCWR